MCVAESSVGAPLGYKFAPSHVLMKLKYIHINIYTNVWLCV